MRSTMENIKQEELVHVDLQGIFRRLLPCLRRYWALVLALMVLLGGLMALRSVRLYRPMYRSEAMFSVSVSTSGQTDLSSYSYYYDNSAAQQAVDSFPYLLNTQRMRELICQKLGTSYINGQIASRSMAGTNCLILSVTSTSAQDAYDILQAVMEVYPQISRQVIGETQLSVSREPAVPTAPYNSLSWKRPLAVGLAAGFVLGMAGLLVMALLRRTVVRPEDVQKIVNLPCLARIPTVQQKKRTNGTLMPLLITRQPSDSAFCESHRLLRLKLLRQLKEEDKVLLVTGSIAGEGKSTLSANLALLLSRDGKRVLLIDGDLRAPSIKEVLNLNKPSLGLGDYLAAPSTSMKVLRFSHEDLFVLAGDEPSDAPLTLLQREPLQNLLAPLRDMFDYIIIDAPPCTTTADASALCVHADRVIYTIREDFATTMQIYDGVQALDDAGANICGFVFTHSTSGSSGSGYGYGYGYGYSRYGSRYGGYGYGKSRKSDTN